MEHNPLFIQEMYIRGFKSIKEARVELRPINIIIGANGSGKSNLLSVFDFVRRELDDNLGQYTNANAIFHFGTENTEHMYIDLIGTDYAYNARFDTYVDSNKINCPKRQLKMFKEVSEYENPMEQVSRDLKQMKTYHFHNTNPKAKVRSAHGFWDNNQLHPDGSNIASILYKIKSYSENGEKYEKQKQRKLEEILDLRHILNNLEKEYNMIIRHLGNYRMHHNPNQHQMEFEEAEKSLIFDDTEYNRLMDDRIRTRRKIMTTRARIYDIIGDNDEEILTESDRYREELRDIYTIAYNEILMSVQTVAPYFKDFILKKDPKDMVELKWRHITMDYMDFHVSQLSDGTLRFILLATLLLQPKLPKIITLDEPELGLHPYALHVLADIIKSISKKTQIILTTQSVEFANLFEPEDFIVVDNKGGESNFKKHDSHTLQAWLKKYNMGDIWRKNVIGGQP